MLKKLYNLLEKPCDLIHKELTSISKLKLIILVLLVLILVIFSKWLFPYSRLEINIPSGEATSTQVQLFNTNNFEDKFPRLVVAELIQTSLNLAWYKVCMINRNKLESLATDPSVEILPQKDTGATDLFIKSSGDTPISKFYTPTNNKKPNCMRIEENKFENSLSISAVYNISHTAKVPLRDHTRIELKIDTSNSKVYLETDQTALWIKRFLVILGSLNLLFFMGTLYKKTKKIASSSDIRIWKK